MLILFVVVFLAYQPVWHAGFIWDDDAHITLNPSIVGGSGLASTWTSSAANYSPLTMTTFWVLHALWGFDPLPYHMSNVLFHATSAVLLWLVLRRLRVRGAWLGATLWALHPVQVESAAWISEIKNTQSAVFYLLAIWYFLEWLETEPLPNRPRPIRGYALALVCAILAILSKASTVMLPVVLGLCWWWVKSRWRWRDALWLTPFFLVALSASVWTIWEQKFHSGALGTDWSQSWAERIVIAGRAIWFYLAKLLWPQPLIFIYPRWAPDATYWASYLPALAAAVAFILLWYYRRRLRPFFFAGAYFGVSLFPVLGFFNVYFFRYSFVGDHFQYLASMGALALAGSGIVTGLTWLREHRASLDAPLCGLLLAGLGFASWSQARTYMNEGTIWRTTVERNPSCSIGHTNLGVWLAKENRYDEALQHFEEAQRLSPAAEETHFNLGVALFRAGRTAEAIQELEIAKRLKTDYMGAYYELGTIFLQLGRLPELGMASAAVEQFREAVRLDPANAEAQNDFGVILRHLGRGDEALVHFEAAVRADPHLADAHYNLGLVLLSVGQHREGIKHLVEAVHLNPNDAEARARLENARRNFGQAE